MSSAGTINLPAPCTTPGPGPSLPTIPSVNPLQDLYSNDPTAATAMSVDQNSFDQSFLNSGRSDYADLSQRLIQTMVSAGFNSDTPSNVTGMWKLIPVRLEFWVPHPDPYPAVLAYYGMYFTDPSFENQIVRLWDPPDTATGQTEPTLNGTVISYIDSSTNLAVSLFFENTVATSTIIAVYKALQPSFHASNDRRQNGWSPGSYFSKIPNLIQDRWQRLKGSFSDCSLDETQKSVSDLFFGASSWADDGDPINFNYYTAVMQSANRCISSALKGAIDSGSATLQAPLQILRGFLPFCGWVERSAESSVYYTFHPSLFIKDAEAQWRLVN